MVGGTPLVRHIREFQANYDTEGLQNDVAFLPRRAENCLKS
jgi:hypothetical protein